MIKGICHPGKDLQEIKDCGFNWVRIDSPFPYIRNIENNPFIQRFMKRHGEDKLNELGLDELKNGDVSPFYLQFKKRCQELKDFGFKIMCNSPIPMAFIGTGIYAPPKNTDRIPMEEVADIHEFLARDLKGLIDGWQISNEHNVYFFRAPLTLDQSIDYIAEGLKGIRRANPDILLGYNFSEYSESSIYMMKKLLPYKDLYNYIGYDGYYGTWIEGCTDDYVTAIEEIYKLTGTEIIMQEFGFASLGDVIQQGELDTHVHDMYGYSSFEDTKKHYVEFLDKIPNREADLVRSVPEDEWEGNLKHIEPHLLKKWACGNSPIPHTEEGQAQFYDELLPKIANIPYLKGFMVFCWQDKRTCFFCHTDDCPCERAWGIRTLDGRNKMAYYTIQKHLSNM